MYLQLTHAYSVATTGVVAAAGVNVHYEMFTISAIALHSSTYRLSAGAVFSAQCASVIIFLINFLVLMYYGAIYKTQPPFMLHIANKLSKNHPHATYIREHN